MVFCSSCGTQLKEGAKFCAACGASVLAEASASESAAVPVADTPPATAQSKSAAAEVSARRSASLKKPSKRAIIIAAAAVIVIAGGVIFAVMSGTGLGIGKSYAASLPSLLGGQNYAGTNAASYFCEATAKVDVDGEEIEYWLFNTYKNDNGNANIMDIVFEKMINDGLFFYTDNLEHYSPNADLHENVKKMMNKKIGGNTHDVSICLLNGYFILNNYDIQKKEFDTVIIPFGKIIKINTEVLAEINKLIGNKKSPPTFIIANEFDENDANGDDGIVFTVAPPEPLDDDYPPDYIFRVKGRSGEWTLQWAETVNYAPDNLVFPEYNYILIQDEWEPTFDKIINDVIEGLSAIQIVHKNNDCYIKVWE